MKIQRVCALYFSGTGNTRKVVTTIAEELAKLLAVPMEELPFTLLRDREKGYSFTESDLLVVGSPTYAGRLPNKIAPDFAARLRGNGTPAVPVVTFGNRNYENSLAELNTLLQKSGFLPVAAAACVAQHAFTSELAYGRPGWSDLFEAKTFAKKISVKLKGLTDAAEPVTVPGDPQAPYYVPLGEDGQPVNFLKAKPKTKLSRCNGCGACARMCPMGAIDRKDFSKVTGTCIKCQTCVHRCTKQAKYFDDPAFLSHVRMLEQTYQEPKENEWFL